MRRVRCVPKQLSRLNVSVSSPVTLSGLLRSVSIVATPSTTLLAIGSIVAPAKAWVAVSGTLVALTNCGLMTGSKSTVLAAALTSMKSVLLLEVTWVSSIALLASLRWGKGGLSKNIVGSRSWSVGLRDRGAGTIGCFRVTKWLQLIRDAGLTRLLTIMLILALSLVRGVSSKRVVDSKGTGAAQCLRSRSLTGSNTTVVTEASSSVISAMERALAKTTNCGGRGSVIIRSLRRHSIRVWLIVDATLSTVGRTITTLAISLLVLVHVVSSIVRA